MFSYTKNQRIHDMNGIKVGGQPGIHPTLMVGTIFYKEQFNDPKSNQEKVKELIEKQKAISEKVSIPSIVDMFIFEKKEIEWKLDFILDNVEGVFSVDIPESDVRIEVLKRLDELGVLDRVIYNSLNLGVTEKEIEILHEKTPKGAVLLAYNPQMNNTQGRVNIIKDGGKLMKKGLLPLAEDIGIDYPLLDTAATPFGEKACESLRAVSVFKNEFGLPTGCSLHNTVESWEWLKRYEDKDQIFDILDCSFDNLPVMLGADFIYYGPIENASYSFPNMAMVNKLIAEGAVDYFGVDVVERHPYHEL